MVKLSTTYNYSIKQSLLIFTSGEWEQDVGWMTPCFCTFRTAEEGGRGRRECFYFICLFLYNASQLGFVNGGASANRSQRIE
jgi:hypothetical protein